MGYPTENLHGDERLVLDLRPHWWTYTPSLAALIASVVAGVAVLVGTTSQPLRLVVAVAVAVCLVWFVTRYVQWATTELVLTSDRLIYRSGVIAKSGIEIPIDRVNTIFFNQKIWERLVGVGDLVIESASATGAQHFENMRRPSAIQNEIYIQKEELEQRRRVRSEMPSATGAAPDMSVADRMAQLNALRDSGAISGEEYAATRARLLNEI
jgi:uncharacterized membrane protein YdbT with pleckstrin-like domain